LTTTKAGYNGNPNRNDDDVPMVMADAKVFQLWRVAAPRAVDANATEVSLPAPDAARWTSGFDQVWQTVKSLYYTSGPSAAAWDALRTVLAAGHRRQRSERSRRRPRRDAAGTAADETGGGVLEECGDVRQTAGVTGGRRHSGKGGNVVDAGIAVALALGVVEPDATSSAVMAGHLFLKGMSEPVVVE
jgi:hypothetical protein